MPKLEQLTPEFVEVMPPIKEPGILYISMRYALAIHKCPCGCGNEAVTPLARPEGWTLTNERGQITLEPSLLNTFPCRSHYRIRGNRVVWC